MQSEGPFTMRSFGVPEDDRFMLIEEFEKSISITAQLALALPALNLEIIQIAANNTRAPEQKRRYCPPRQAFGQKPRHPAAKYSDRSLGGTRRTGRLAMGQRNMREGRPPMLAGAG